MKRHLIISLAIAALPLLASAQNKAIEDLAKAYSDRKGFSTTVIKGELLTGMGRGVNVKQIDISSLMKDITSIIIVSSDKPDKQFADDVRTAVAAGNYTTIMSVSDNGEQIKFLLSTAPEAESRKETPRNEFVMMILGKDDNMVVSIVGNYKVKKISKTDDSEREKEKEESKE